jgi:hypothetical protein
MTEPNGSDPLIIDLDVLHLWLAERGRNSKSYGSHADAYEVVARKVGNIIQRHHATRGRRTPVECEYPHCKCPRHGRCLNAES